MNSIQRSPSPELFSSQEYSRAISEDRFFKLFDPAKVPHAIKVGDGLCVDENSMNACWIDDGIVLFGIEKRLSKPASVMGYHISDKTSVSVIIMMLGIFANEENDYDLYLIGGKETTTSGQACLLENIHTAIDDFFKGKVNIVQRLINLCGMDTFIHANMNMDGTLTYCQL